MNTPEANLTTVTAPAAPNIHIAPEAAAKPPHHAVPLGRVAFILAVLILAGAVAGFIPRLRQRRAAQNDIAALATTTVTLVSPEPGKADDGLLLPAEVEPLVQASIFAQVSGYL